MTARFAATIAGNLCLYISLFVQRKRYRGLLRVQSWSLVSTAIMASAQFIPHSPSGDYLYNSLWTVCDLADAVAECWMAILLWRCTDWAGEEWLKPLVVLAMLSHLYIKLQEYWAYDIFSLRGWIAFFHARQWLNLVIVWTLCLVLYHERAQLRMENEA